MGIAHCDLKLENIMLQGESLENCAPPLLLPKCGRRYSRVFGLAGCVKLGDFGLSKKFRKGGDCAGKRVPPRASDAERNIYKTFDIVRCNEQCGSARYHTPHISIPTRTLSVDAAAVICRLR